MRFGFYQSNPVCGDVKRNLDVVATRLATAHCDLMVLPELFASGYQFVSKEEVESLAEPVPDGPTTRRLLELARARGMHLVAGLPERHANRCYNSAVLVGPSGFLRLYPKAHPFFEEARFFHPGAPGLPVLVTVS